MPKNDLPKCMILKTDGSIQTKYFEFNRLVDDNDLKKLLSTMVLSKIKFSDNETMIGDMESMYKLNDLNKCAGNFLHRNGLPGCLIYGTVIVISNRFLK